MGLLMYSSHLKRKLLNYNIFIYVVYSMFYNVKIIVVISIIAYIFLVMLGYKIL